MPHTRTIILLTNRIPYPLHDGGALAMDAMIRGYREAGWQVHVLAMNTSRHHVQADVLNRLYPHIAGFHAVAVDNAISSAGILKNLFLSRAPEHADRFKSNDFNEAPIMLLRKVHPRVVQLESPFLASYLPTIRAEAPAAITVYRMHNVEGQIWSRLADESSGIRRLYLRLLAKRMTRYERRLWADADLLLPITEADAATVSDTDVLTQAEVAPFGIYLSSLPQALPAGPFKLYHIGAMDWPPNAEAVSWFLKEVWPKLHAIAPEATFHFAGRAMPASFHEHLPEGAFCAGEVADAKAFIRDKHLLVVPLRSGGGIRVKILEAMAEGKLVISTDVGMQGIAAINERHYLAANSAPDFIRLAGRAAEHPEKAAVFVHEAQLLVRERYDAAAIMSRVVRRLESMIAS